MRIDDFIMSGMSVFLKIGRFNLDEQSKQEILQKGLYHITPSEEISQKILETQHIRPTKGFTAYGRACAFMFNGTPSVSDYIINVMSGSKDDPYLNPTKTISAIKISPKRKEELANYKVRGLVDQAIMYEGYCVLPPNEVESVLLVPDLVRDSEGKPVVDSKTGRYTAQFREASKEELSVDNKYYNAKEDYLQFMAQERERMSYKEGNNIISNVGNSVHSIWNGEKIIGEMVRQNIFKNIVEVVKRKIAQMRTPKLEMSVDEKIEKGMYQYDKSQKNPYRNAKFAKEVANMQAEGKNQLEFKDELEKLTTSDIGKYFRNKYAQLQNSTITQNDIEHNNRVAIHSSLIAMNEGILENDKNNKTLDLILSTAYYHDAGRRKIKNMQLQFADGKQYTEEDKNTLLAMVEAIDAKDKKMPKICEKYKIEPNKTDYVMKLMSIVKDADALDRVRFDKNLPVMYQTDLNSKYLRTETSRKLLNASYQLEAITKKAEFSRVLAYHTDEQQLGGEKKTKREQFVGYLKDGIVQVPDQVKNLKPKIKLNKEKISTRYTGKIKNMIKSFKENKMQRHSLEEER